MSYTFRFDSSRTPDSGSLWRFIEKASSWCGIESWADEAGEGFCSRHQFQNLFQSAVKPLPEGTTWVCKSNCNSVLIAYTAGGGKFSPCFFRLQPASFEVVGFQVELFRQLVELTEPYEAFYYDTSLERSLRAKIRHIGPKFKEFTKMRSMHYFSDLYLGEKTELLDSLNVEPGWQVVPHFQGRICLTVDEGGRPWLPSNIDPLIAALFHLGSVQKE